MRSNQTALVQKNTFKLLFAALAVILMLLPFVTTFNTALTELINRVGFYNLIQERIVPWESRFVVVLIRLLRVPGFLAGPADRADFYIIKGDENLAVNLLWNCLGWQSGVLLIISFVAGLQGNFSRLSRLECIAIGLLGTFLMNIFRMVFITVGIYHINSVFAMLIHDYFAALTTILWLFFFWWFSYSFVLEKREPIAQEEAIKV